MKKFILLCFIQLPLILTATKHVSAQDKAVSARLSGKVTDEKPAPLDFATIRLLLAKDSSLVRTAITNADGLYIFEKVPAGTYIPENVPGQPRDPETECQRYL